MGMTQEDRELLLKDICTRLPYGIFVKEGDVDDRVIYTYDYHPHIETCKPYLRPMSSMSEEEYKEFCKISGLRKDEYGYFSNHLPEWGNSIITERVMVRTIDWLNSHYFDYRGLIPMGLALEASEEMYKTE